MQRKYDPRICSECGGKRIELQDYDPDGVVYRYWHCTKCGDKVLDMEQLHEAAKTYRRMKAARISKWGTAMAIRIPKEIVKQQKLKVGDTAYIIPEKKGFKVIPE